MFFFLVFFFLFFFDKHSLNIPFRTKSFSKTYKNLQKSASGKMKKAIRKIMRYWYLCWINTIQKVLFPIEIQVISVCCVWSQPYFPPCCHFCCCLCDFCCCWCFGDCCCCRCNCFSFAPLLHPPLSLTWRHCYCYVFLRATFCNNFAKFAIFLHDQRLSKAPPVYAEEEESQ